MSEAQERLAKRKYAFPGDAEKRRQARREVRQEEREAAEKERQEEAERQAERELQRREAAKRSFFREHGRMPSGRELRYYVEEGLAPGTEREGLAPSERHNTKYQPREVR